MKRPIRDQLLWPLTGLLLVAITANAIFAAWWASSRALESLADRQNQIMAVLAESNFPLSTSVIEKLRGLTGDDFIVWDSNENRAIAGSLPIDPKAFQEVSGAMAAMGDGRAINRVIAGKAYLVSSRRVRFAPSQALLVLTSDDVMKRASRSALWPPLAVGTITILVSIPLVILLASGWARRMRRLERHVEAIARGEFGLELTADPVDDELAGLVTCINFMSRKLNAMQDEIIRGERTRLIAQLTAGFAHQLRNGLAGAKLALQLHQNRCPSPKDSSLDVANQQLTLVEEEVRGLLALGKGEAKAPTDVDLTALITSVQTLVNPACLHQGVAFHVTEVAERITVRGFGEGLRAALLNIILNAIEACGSGGNVWVTLITEADVVTVRVEDDGPGPPPELAATIFESFVTSKKEGVGLGLAVAAAVARDHEGTLQWNRNGDRTRFELRIPRKASEKDNQ